MIHCDSTACQQKTSEGMDQTTSKDDQYTPPVQPPHSTNKSSASSTHDQRPPLQLFDRIILKLNGKAFMDRPMPETSASPNQILTRAEAPSVLSMSSARVTRSAKPLNDQKKIILDLQLNIKQLKAQRDKGTYTITELEHAIRTKDAEIRSKSQKLQSSEAGASGSSTKIKSLEKRLEELGGKTKKYEVERSSWEKEKEITERINEELQDELDLARRAASDTSELRSKLEDAETMEELLRKTMAQLKDDGIESERALQDRLVYTKDKLQAKLQKANSTNDRLTEENTKSKSKAEELYAHAKVWKTSVLSLSQQLKTKTSRLEKLKLKGIVRQRRAKKSKLDLDSLKKKATELEQKIKGRDTGVKERDTTIHLLSNKIEDLELQIDTSQSKADEGIKNQLDAMTFKLITVQEELNATTKDLIAAQKTLGRKDVIIHNFSVQETKSAVNKRKRAPAIRNHVPAAGQNAITAKSKREVIVLEEEEEEEEDNNDTDVVETPRLVKKVKAKTKRRARRDSRMDREDPEYMPSEEE